MSSKAMKKMSTSLSSHAFAGKTGKTASGLSKGDVVKKKRGSNEHAALERQLVWEGEFGHTRTGLEKANLVKKKNGKIVSKKLHLQGKRSQWIVAVAAARKAHPNLKGSIKKGSPLYNAAMALKN